MTTEPCHPSVPPRASPAAVCVAMARRTRGILDEQVATWVRRQGRPLAHHLAPVLMILLLFFAMGGTWQLARAAPADGPSTATSTNAREVATARAGADTTTSGSERRGARGAKKPASALTGKLNLNTASEEQLVMLPAVGPAKAERIVVWRKKNGGFRRIADLRRVKGFGYKTFKRLEPLLAVTGENTLR